MLYKTDVNGISLYDGNESGDDRNSYVTLISILKNNYPMYFHKFYEMELVIEGCEYQQINGKKIFVQPGSFYLITPKDIHGYFVTEEIKIISIHILNFEMDTVLMNTLGRAQCMHYVELNEDQFPHVRFSMELLTETFFSGTQPYPKYINSLLVTLVSYIIYASNTVMYENLSSGTTSTFRRIQDFIEDNFARPINLTQVAEHVFLHPGYLSSVFSKWFGCSFPTYVNRYRLERAATLLAVTDAPISEVAFSSGFGNVSNFIRCFSRMYHLSPKAYRMVKKKKEG